MNPDFNQDISTKRSAARRMGGQIFMWASIAYMVGIGGLFWGITDIDNLYDSLKGKNRMEDLALPQLLRDKEFLYMVTSSLGAAATFVAVAWLLGRWAGSAIQVKKRGFGWVGPLTMVLPSILGSLVGALMVAMQDKSFMRQMERDLVENFLLPWAVCSFLVFLAGAIIGVLAGLYVRQQGRLFGDRLHADAMGFSGTARGELPPNLSLQRARSLGMIVFGVAALLLAFVRLVSFMFQDLGFYQHDLEVNSILPMVMAHLVFVGLAAWSGRAAGAAILKRGAHFGIVGAGYMVLPTVVSPIVLRGMLYLMRRDEFVWASGRPVDYYVYPVLENALLFYILAALLGIFGGLVLRHLGRWDAEEDTN